jgi:hypothetical protein
VGPDLPPGLVVEKVSELDSGELHEVNNVTNAFVRVNKQRRDVHAYK